MVKKVHGLFLLINIIVFINCYAMNEGAAGSALSVASAIAEPPTILLTAEPPAPRNAVASAAMAAEPQQPHDQSVDYKQAQPVNLYKHILSELASNPTFRKEVLGVIQGAITPDIQIQQQIRRVTLYIKKLQAQNKPVYLVLGVSNGEQDLGKRFNESYLFLDVEQAKPEDERSFRVDFNRLPELQILASGLADTFDGVFVDSSVFCFMDWSPDHLRQIKKLLKTGGNFSFVPDCFVGFECIPKYNKDNFEKRTLTDLRAFAKEIAAEASRNNQFALGHKSYLGSRMICQEQTSVSFVRMCVPPRIFFANEDTLYLEKEHLPPYIRDSLRFGEVSQWERHNESSNRYDYLTTIIFGDSTRERSVWVSDVMSAAVFNEFLPHFRAALTTVFQENSGVSQEVVTVELGKELPFKVHYRALYPFLFTATKPKQKS